VLKFGENSTANRSAIVWLKAGRLRYPVTVTQSTLPDLSLQLLKDNKDITEMIFASIEGTTPDPQTLTVNWKPTDANLMLVNTPVGVPIPTEAGVPNTQIITGTGTVSYPISPSALTPEELIANPFLEKASLLTFTVGDGVSYETKSVMLRQIDYRLLPSAVEYTLNDYTQSKTINVRSNFNWEITNVSDNHNILVNASGLVGTTGNANTGVGYPLAITLQSQSSSKVNEQAVITLKNRMDNSPNSPTWKITITAIDALYVGMFAGPLKETNTNEWQFERKLYMQIQDHVNAQGEPGLFKWKSEKTATTGTKDFWNGKGNTLAMITASTGGVTHPAASACFEKNSNHALIGDEDDANYWWYLPAQNQLQAIYVSYNSFGTDKPSSDYATVYNSFYWSSSEYPTNGSYASFIHFFGGWMTGREKTDGYRVRCVREGTTP
jgi:hypothetical protein